jgi:hypothetical protein
MSHILWQWIKWGCCINKQKLINQVNKRKQTSTL